jgi:hypothetical protein
MNMHRNQDLGFPISSADQLDIYALYEILKRRGRLDTERLSGDLGVSRKIRDLSNKLDMEQRIIDRRTCRREGHELL